MKGWMLSLLLAAVCNGALPVHDDSTDPATWFERLQSGSAQERDAAQRWLGVNLTVEHYPLLAAQARRADAEAQRRLTLALASEPRHLELALLLVDEQNRVLRGIGDRALDELVTRWCPRVNRAPVTEGEVEERLAQGAPQVMGFGGSTESLFALIDRLDQWGGIGVPVVVDTGIADRVIGVPRAESSGFGLLEALCRAEGLAFSGVGDWSAELPGPGAWILVSAKGGARKVSGAARLLGWFRELQTGGPEATAAARALALCGWPAALHWLDQRWQKRHEVAVLEGLLAAASRGRAARSMWTRDLREQLLARADRALQAPQQIAGDHGRTNARLAQRIARGLIGAGPMQLGGGLSTSLWIANWEALGERQRWLRLVILEGQRSGGERLANWLRGELMRPGANSPAIQFQALRALGAMPTRLESGWRVAAWPELVTWAQREHKQRALVRLVIALGLQAPREGLPASRGIELFFLQLALLRRDAPAAAAECISLGRRPGRRTRLELIEQLERARFEAGPALVRQVAQSALAGAEPNSLAYMKDTFLFAGALVETPGKTELENGPPWTAEQLRRLGAWSGVPAGRRARKILLGALADPPGPVALRQALVTGLEMALRRLRQADQDHLARDFTKRIRLTLARAPQSPLHARLDDPRWPSAKSLHVTLLLDLERELPDLN